MLTKRTITKMPVGAKVCEGDGLYFKRQNQERVTGHIATPHQVAHMKSGSGPTC